MAEEKKFKIGDREFTVQKPTFKRMDEIKELGFDFVNGDKAGLKENIGKNYTNTAKALAIMFSAEPSEIDENTKFIYENADMVDFTSGISFFASAFTSRLNAIQTNLSPEAKTIIEESIADEKKKSK